MFRRDTASALAKANDDLAAVEIQIAALQQERASKLLDTPLGQIAQLDQRIADQDRAATVFRDRIAALETKVSAEEQARDEAEYQAEVDRLERPVSAYAHAVANAESVAEVLAEALREVAKREAAVRKQGWRGTELYLSTGWIGSRFGDRLAPDVIDRIRRRPVSGDEWFTLLSRLDVSGIGETAADQGRRLLETLRHAHDPNSDGG